MTNIQTNVMFSPQDSTGINTDKINLFKTGMPPTTNGILYRFISAYDIERVEFNEISNDETSIYMFIPEVDPKVLETVNVIVYVPGVLKQTGPGLEPLYDSGVPFWNVHSKLIGLPVELLVNVIHSPWHNWLADIEKFAVGD